MSAITGTRVPVQSQQVDLINIAQRNGAVSAPKNTKTEAPFKQVLAGELNSTRNLQISKHALERLHSRKIDLSKEMLDRISEAVDKADTKGSRETLVLTDSAALVVSVKNRTIITAFDREHLREGVVTSIDSAVIL
jgi:flagellar operon protein